VTYTATDACGNVAMCSFTVLVSPSTAPSIVYVDDSYVGLPAGTFVSFPWPGSIGGPYVIGCDAFATVQGGVTQ